MLTSKLSVGAMTYLLGYRYAVVKLLFTKTKTRDFGIIRKSQSFQPLPLLSEGIIPLFSMLIGI